MRRPHRHPTPIEWTGWAALAALAHAIIIGALVIAAAATTRDESPNDTGEITCTR